MSNNDDYELEFAHYMEDEAPEEAPKREGMGLGMRAILQTIWFGITGTAAYFLVQYLVDERIINLRSLYDAGIPTSVPEEVFFWVFVVLLVAIMQFVRTFGFLLANPEGRKRTGGGQPKKKVRKRRRR